MIAFVAAFRKGSISSRFDSNYRTHPRALKVTRGAIHNYGFTHERSDIEHGTGNEETHDYGIQDQGLEYGGHDEVHEYEGQDEIKGFSKGFGDEETAHAEEESHGYNVNEGHGYSVNEGEGYSGHESQGYSGHEANEGTHGEVHEASFGFGGDEESDSYGHEDSHDVDYFAHPAYKYEYGVKDHKTGDHKSHWEHRDGDKVTGEYTVDEADGTKRIVSYTSDKKNGFQAIVKTIGTPHFPEHHSSHKDDNEHH